MTLPDERYRSIKWAESFLKELLDPAKTPRVPKNIRNQARSILRHYPSEWDLERLASKSPDVIIKQMEPLTRMVLSYEQEKNSDNAS